MKRWLVVALLAAAMSMLPTTAAAKDDKGGGHATHFGPYKSSSTDSGTCGNDWANDTYKREFDVRPAGSGSWEVTETFTGGKFETMTALSPGACETTTAHGTMISAGVNGKFHGFLDGTVTGGTFDPNGCQAPTADCSTTSGFILAAFGPTAGYSCVTGVGDCSFKFDYHAHGKGLLYHHWINASADQGGNQGDIATS